MTADVHGPMFAATSRLIADQHERQADLTETANTARQGWETDLDDITAELRRAYHDLDQARNPGPGFNPEHRAKIRERRAANARHIALLETEAARLERLLDPERRSG